MDTSIVLTLYGRQAKAAAEAMEEEILSLENQLSTEISNSEIAQLNRNNGGTLSDRVNELWECASYINRITAGAFDLTLYPLSVEWGFIGGDYQVPDKGTIQQLLIHIGMDKIQYDREAKTLSFEEGTKLDFGGIAKGYASMRLLAVLSEYDVDSALINLGGNVQVYGKKPDASTYKVAIRDPLDSENYLGILSACDVAVVTSGGYERCFTSNGKTYHHLLDPATGYPAENGVSSVTVVCQNGTYADGLSTALFILGPEKSKELWKSGIYDFDFCMLTTSEELYVTEGLLDRLESSRPIIPLTNQ